MDAETTMEQTQLILPVSFDCSYGEDFDIEIILENDNRFAGLEQAWLKAIEYYCPDRQEKMRQQLKRKLGAVYGFYDLSDVVLRFTNEHGKRAEITASVGIVE